MQINNNEDVNLKNYFFTIVMVDYENREIGQVAYVMQ